MITLTYWNEGLKLSHVRILIIAYLLFVAEFDPYLVFNFLIILVCLLFMVHIFITLTPTCQYKTSLVDYKLAIGTVCTVSQLDIFINYIDLDQQLHYTSILNFVVTTSPFLWS